MSADQRCPINLSQFNAQIEMSWTDNLGFKLQLIACICAFLFFQFKENPIYAKTDINVITAYPVVEQHLTQYKDLIGSDYDGYRNHIYRVMTYSMHFLHNDNTNIDVIATALVYHDIGLWTAKTLAYLEPGVELARKECEHIYSSDELNLQDAIILNHHKLWPVQNSTVVEAVRKADWIDASNGIFNKGMPRKHIQKVKEILPAAGFYNTLMDIGPRIHGNDFMKILSEIITIFKW